MNLLKDAKYALKLSVDFRLATPLLLRSGRTGDLTDSAIERSTDGRLHINGYVWASLMRRTLGRLAKGKDLAAQIGKHEDMGVSALWCESTFTELHGTVVNPGIAIDRKYGSAQSGALFSDELAVAGLPLPFHATLFARNKDEADIWRAALLEALSLVNLGAENIGGGWTYGYGRLHVAAVSIRELDLSQHAARQELWRQPEGDAEQSLRGADLPQVDGGCTLIHVRAQVAPGQLMAVKSSVFPMNAPEFGKLPDSFIFRRNRWCADTQTMAQYPLIPGKAIRQALLSVPLERQLRSKGEKICWPSTKGDCGCKRCRWFGSTDNAGILAVTDAPIEHPTTEVLSRIQLCEHSMQNMNLFSGEYLTGGAFRFDIIIDGQRGRDSAELCDEIVALLDEMKGETAPPGWYRLGGTSTCTGQIQVLDYTLSGGRQS